MKSITPAAAVALLVLSVGSAQVLAQSGPSANGDFQFALTGATGAIQFNAKAQGSGATGHVQFSANALSSGEDVDGDGSGSADGTGVTMDVAVNCIKVSGNRAAMSGVITSASAPGLAGVRVVLAVEDGGEGSKQGSPDRFTWGAYRSTAKTWMPSDAEVPGDNGWMFSWTATDFERPDDAGVLISNSTQAGIDCKSFPVGAYAFEDISHGAGNINVKP
jgi:hypothetical protein